MPTYIFDHTLRGGTWEASQDGTSFRLSCLATRNNPPTTLGVGLTGSSSDYAWLKDGSEIGRTTRYNVKEEDGSVASPPGFTGSAFSAQHTFANNFFPLVNSVYYPEPITDGSGGWKYKPLNVNLPTTLTDTTIPFGFISDLTVKISFVKRYQDSINHKWYIKREMEITDVTFDTSWETFYLSEDIGNGDAFIHNYTNPQELPSSRYRYYVGWANHYSGTWLTQDRLPENVQSGVTTHYGTTRFSCMSSIGQVAGGSYNASDLVANGHAGFVKNGVFVLGSYYRQSDYYIH